jgi:hypothetical protein
LTAGRGGARFDPAPVVAGQTRIGEPADAQPDPRILVHRR